MQSLLISFQNTRNSQCTGKLGQSNLAKLKIATHFLSQNNCQYKLIKSEHIFHTKTVFEFQLNKVKQIIFITYYIKLEK